MLDGELVLLDDGSIDDLFDGFEERCNYGLNEGFMEDSIDGE